MTRLIKLPYYKRARQTNYNQYLTQILIAFVKNSRL